MKVVTYDIEVSPMKAWVYGSKWDPKLVKIIEQQKLLSIGYKYLDKKKTHVIANKPQKEMLQEFWSVLDECDTAIGHNVDKFDRRMMNAFFLREGMKPPSPYHTIDTLKIARKYFYLPSNSLRDLAVELGLDPKLDCGFEVAEGCLNGDSKAWKKMITYNRRDVTLTEEVYIILRAWDTNIASIAEDRGQCKACGSEHLHINKTVRNKQGTVQRIEYKCSDCGAYNASKKGTSTTIDIK